MLDIMLNGQVVGKARICKEGLYFCFDCCCRFSGEIVFRLQVQCGERTENLGIPVPQGKDFVLRTRIPAKRLGDGELTVRAIPKHSRVSETFIPIAPEEPFRYLQRLQNAFLAVRDGKTGIVIPEREDQPQLKSS